MLTNSEIRELLTAENERLRAENERLRDTIAKMRATWTSAPIRLRFGVDRDPATGPGVFMIVGSGDRGAPGPFFTARKETGLMPKVEADPPFDDWSSKLSSRWRRGALEYGDVSFYRAATVNVDEVLAEQLDIAGWLFVLWVQRRLALRHGIDLNARAGLEVEFVDRVRTGEHSSDPWMRKIEKLAAEAYLRHTVLEVQLSPLRSACTFEVGGGPRATLGP